MRDTTVWLVAVYRDATGKPSAGQALGPYHADELFAIHWGTMFLRSLDKPQPDIYRVEQARNRDDARRKAENAARKAAV